MGKVPLDNWPMLGRELFHVDSCIAISLSRCPSPPNDPAACLEFDGLSSPRQRPTEHLSACVEHSQACCTRTMVHQKSRARDRQKESEMERNKESHCGKYKRGSFFLPETARESPYNMKRGLCSMQRSSVIPANPSRYQFATCPLCCISLGSIFTLQDSKYAILRQSPCPCS